MQIEIDHEIYGDATRFDSLDEAQSAIRACGEDFARTTLAVRGTEIINEDGLVVGVAIRTANEIGADALSMIG